MQRIDTFLVEHQLVESREQAKRLILAGAVTVNGDSMIKPGQRIPANAKVVVQAQQQYVSRGGFKLEKALSTFGVDVRDRVALDVGASTGGFTDCLLQHGAKFVYAVDVGYGQLAWKLRTHPQVLPIEKTNIRQLTLSHLENREPRTANREPQHGMEGRKKGRLDVPQSSVKKISVTVIDVSFISLRTVLPIVVNLLTQQNGGQWSAVSGELDIIALLKPQFEAGRAHVKKGGVVSDKRVHIETRANLSVFASEKLDATLMGLTYSPIHKDIANIEYLLWFRVDPNAQADVFGPNQTTVEIVEAAFEQFP
ncbi:MAG: TlyA family RNA methyltransferase [Candidatus Poribacteria bacterium]|nr:TlyA family RNA methyltransferase [Candidatus Poribacteria bacterium]